MERRRRRRRRRGPERGRQVRRDHRLEPGLCLRIARSRDRPGLRGGGADSLQEPALPERRSPGLGHPGAALGAALGLRGNLDPRGPRQRELSHSVGPPGRPRGAAAGPGARPHARVHHQGGRGADHAGLRLSRHARSRGQPALGRHTEPRGDRDGQPGLFAGRGRRRPGDAEPAVRPVLPGEATLLPRGPRAVRHAQQPDLHAPHRAARVRRQARRQGRRHRNRLPRRRRQQRPVGHRRAPDLQHAAPAARPGTDVHAGRGLHRPHRRR